MNLFYAARHADALLQRGDINGALNCIKWAEAIINDPAKDINNPNITARCCYFTMEDGKIHCGRDENEPIFLASPEERSSLCQNCALSSKKKIDNIKLSFSALLSEAA